MFNQGEAKILQRERRKDYKNKKKEKERGKKRELWESNDGSRISIEKSDEWIWSSFFSTGTVDGIGIQIRWNESYLFAHHRRRVVRFSMENIDYE